MKSMQAPICVKCMQAPIYIYIYIYIYTYKDNAGTLYMCKVHADTYIHIHNIYKENAGTLYIYIYIYI
jgi:hypothetical protein